MVLVRVRLAIVRSGSIENRLNVMDCNTFRLIPAILRNLIVLSFRRLLTQYFTGTRIRLNTISIYRIFQ
jgi:hypothetical protein